MMMVLLLVQATMVKLCPCLCWTMKRLPEEIIRRGQRKHQDRPNKPNILPTNPGPIKGGEIRSTGSLFARISLRADLDWCTCCFVSHVDTCVETLCKYLENIITHPDEEKYQKIRLTNRAFCERVQPIEGAMDLLMAAGFEQKKITNTDGLEEDYLVFNVANVPSVESLTTLIDALRTAEPIQLELDRNLQVLLPSQAANKMALPPAFYALTPAEIKREQQLRQEAIEKSQMLRTKAMREKDEVREMRKYKFAIIRVRFPDGILLQGTFSVYERYTEVHEFVKENLEHSELPFILNHPTGHKLNIDEDANKTLIDLRLVPATVLNFAWHPSVIEQINSSPNRDVYLKPEVMVLVQDI